MTDQTIGKPPPTPRIRVAITDFPQGVPRQSAGTTTSRSYTIYGVDYETAIAAIEDLLARLAQPATNGHTPPKRVAR